MGALRRPPPARPSPAPAAAAAASAVAAAISAAASRARLATVGEAGSEPGSEPGWGDAAESEGRRRRSCCPLAGAGSRGGTGRPVAGLPGPRSSPSSVAAPREWWRGRRRRRRRRSSAAGSRLCPDSSSFMSSSLLSSVWPSSTSSSSPSSSSSSPLSSSPRRPCAASPGAEPRCPQSWSLSLLVGLAGDRSALERAMAGSVGSPQTARDTVWALRPRRTWADFGRRTCWRNRSMLPAAAAVGGGIAGVASTSLLLLLRLLLRDKGAGQAGCCAGAERPGTAATPGMG